MKGLTKILSMGVGVIVCLVLLAGCGNGNEYNAIVLESGLSFKSEFLKDNMTLGAYYYNENYNPEEDPGAEYLRDETSPKYRIFIVRNQTERNLIFSNIQDVDFEKEMLLVYCYTDIYSRPRIIKSLELEGTTLNVEFTIKKSKKGVGDASMPQRRILVIKMKALDIETVMFTKK